MVENDVSASEYAEDKQLEAQVEALHTPEPKGLLAQLILKARQQGLLKPVSSYSGT